MITDKDGNKKLIPLVESAIQQPQTEQTEPCQNSEVVEADGSVQQHNQPALRSSAPVCTSTMPRRTGSLSIIFRKVRNMF